MTMPTIWTEGSRYVLIRFNDEGSKCPNYFVADDANLNQWLSDEMAEDFIEEFDLKKITKMVVED